MADGQSVGDKSGKLFGFVHGNKKALPSNPTPEQVASIQKAVQSGTLTVDVETSQAPGILQTITEHEAKENSWAVRANTQQKAFMNAHLGVPYDPAKRFISSKATTDQFAKLFGGRTRTYDRVKRQMHNRNGDVYGVPVFANTNILLQAARQQQLMDMYQAEWLAGARETLPTIAEIEKRAAAEFSHNEVVAMSTPKFSERLMTVLAKADGETHAVLILWPSRRAVTIKGQYGFQVEIKHDNGKVERRDVDQLSTWPEAVFRLLNWSSEEIAAYNAQLDHAVALKTMPPRIAALLKPKKKRWITILKAEETPDDNSKT